MSRLLFGAILGLLGAGLSSAAGPSAQDLARSIRGAGLDPEECYRVRDLNIQKEDIRLYFTDGYLIFSKPLAGKRRAAVFTAEVEGGDGEVLLLPPTRGERQSLAAFTQSANLDEHFTAALMIFTDGSTGDVLERMVKETAARKSAEMGAVLAEKWTPVLNNVQTGFDIRIIQDLMAPSQDGGMLFLALNGRQTGSFDVIYDPRSREQIVAGQLTERNGEVAYNVWTSFAARSARSGDRKPESPWFSVTGMKIDAVIDPALKMSVVTRATVQIGAGPLRMFPFEISRAMKVASAKIDGAPAELFFQESQRGRALRGGENDVFLVVAPDALSAGTRHEIEFEHGGAVISEAGHGVYFVSARSNWYPRTAGGFATYDLTFHYPKRLTLVAPGDSVEDRIDGDSRLTRWRTPVPIRMAGFNLGEYEKVSGSVPGYTIDVYGNRYLEASLQPKPRVAQVEPPLLPRARNAPAPKLAAALVSPPDPLARLRAVTADVFSSLEFFAARFGPPALKTLTVAPIPGTFGQGFPGLVYLSTLSYIDPTDRPASMRDSTHQTFFSALIAPHEVAHQWWGDVVTTSSYQDEWMLEALSSYSALLWLEKKSGPKAVNAVLDTYRDHLLAHDQQGATIESAGPITWGNRLAASPLPDAWRTITYEKGAWIYHMLRKRLGDQQFLKMLAELRRRYEFKSVATEDLRTLAKEFVPPRVPPSAIDTFFDSWVYSTGIPTLKLKYAVQGAAPNVKVSGTLSQTGVDDDFAIEVPVEFQFAKGAPQTIWVNASSDAATFSARLKQVPARVVVGGVLAKK